MYNELKQEYSATDILYYSYFNFIPYYYGFSKKVPMLKTNFNIIVHIKIETLYHAF